MILKKLLFILYFLFINTQDNCASFYHPTFQNTFAQQIEKERFHIKTDNTFQYYNIPPLQYPKLSKYFKLIIQFIKDKDDYEKSRNIAKYRKALAEIDVYGRFFPKFCTYFEIETLNQKKSFTIVEKSGSSLSGLIKKGGIQMLSFLEKYAIMKKISKIVSIFHIHELQLCQLNTSSFKVYLDDKQQYDEELLSDQFQAQNLRYSKFYTIQEHLIEENCPIIKKFDGNESPEQIDRQILFDDIEKNYKKRSDVYQMAFVFIQFFFTNEEYENIRNLALTRTTKNLKEVNDKISSQIEELLNEVKQTQIDQQYQIGFQYFIELILRMLQYNPSDRLSSYDIFQGFIGIISNKVSNFQAKQIKTATFIKFKSLLKESQYTNNAKDEFMQNQSQIQALINEAAKSPEKINDDKQIKDDFSVNRQMKNMPKLEKPDQNKKQMSV